MTDKNRRIISRAAENPSDDMRHPFLIRAFSNAGNEGSYPDMIKAVYETPTANSMPGGQNVSLSLKNTNKNRMPPFATLL